VTAAGTAASAHAIAGGPTAGAVSASGSIDAAGGGDERADGDIHGGVQPVFSYVPGAGVGIPTCIALLEHMNSQLFLTTQPGGGSIFSFTLTLRRGISMPSRVTAVPRERDPSTLHPVGLRVLVADDVQLNRMLTIVSIRKALPEPRVDEAGSGEEALQLLLAEDYDLVILDEFYGGRAYGFADASTMLRGTDITRRFKELRPNSQTLIVGYTVSDHPGHEAYALASGQDLVWCKKLPLKDEVATQVSEALINKRARISTPAPT